MFFNVFIFLGFTNLILFCPQGVFLLRGNEENSPPKVVITKPVATTRLPWNSIVPYSIHVNDREDGNSEYDEIPRGQVLLLVNYFPKAIEVKTYLDQGRDKMPEPLVQMSKSTCLICHTSKAKLIGPSFDLIAGRYNGKDPGQVDALAQKIISGSKGTWGELIMPPHPDLEIGQVKKMVSWILEHGANPNQSFYTGTEGAFRTVEKTVGEAGIYILTASYTDHGLNNLPNSSVQGRHTIAISPE